MREISVSEREEIWTAKKNWERGNKNRKLYRCYQLSDINILMKFSDFANVHITSN